MQSNKNAVQIHKGVDGILIVIYLLMVALGILSIIAVKLRPGDVLMKQLFSFKEIYSKQLLFFCISILVAIFILLTDSKFFTATANLQYALGILLLLLVFAIGTNVKGTKSIIRFGGFQFQPIEICKIFTALALAKFLSRPETDFSKRRDQLIVAAIALTPAIISVLQNETGVALVYLSFFIMMYREGLPGIYLTLGFSLTALVILSLLFAGNPNMFLLIIGGLSVLSIYVLRKQIKRKRSVLFGIIAIAAGCLVFERVLMPFVFTKVVKAHQSSRIFSTLGMENPYAPKEESKIAKPKDDYNVMQSKIAIGSGGWVGKGYLKGTLTTGNFVPEQSTDFIFCTIGESFGFLGSFIYLALYALLLFRITIIAERQRSTFSRVYAYCVASIFFFHLLINVGMVTGIMPVIGIPLPFLSYGGTSLISFTMMLFILIKLDSDKQMVLR
jgi:rod shape determining protein RodA